MVTTSTRSIYFLFSIILTLLLLLGNTQVNAQIYKVDLSEKPNSEWESSKVSRDGDYCGGENCIQFEVTLHKDAGGLEVAILDGAEGAMFYRLNCGEEVRVGEPICVSGVGPHTITICKPGNSKNTYKIISVAAFDPQPDFTVTGGCSATLNAPLAFEEASITWTDLTGGGRYLEYLSFPNGKANPVVTPTGMMPEYVDYQVCGSTLETECATLPYCDVVRVYFKPKPVVSIGPSPAIICPGSSGIELKGTVTGGDGNFDYIWTNASRNVVGNGINYTATTVGTYTLEIRNQNNNASQKCETFSTTIEVINNLSVNAGPDQLICSTGTATLAGTVTAATGGVWSGGSGTFSSTTDLNATYTPSQADIDAGSVKLTLTTTGNGACSAIKDEVVISFYKMELSFTGTPVICNGTLGTITAIVTGAQGQVFYLWSSGENTASISNKAAGTYRLFVSDEKGCSFSKDYTITEVTGPTDFTASATSSTCGNSNGEISVSGATGGTAPYTYSKNGGTTYQTASTFMALAAGNYNITVKDKNGCTFTKSISVTNVAGPTAVSATSQPASCNNNDGTITAGAVTGGITPYKYAINGRDFQTETVFSGVASGTYTLTVQDANGCIVTTSVSVGKNLLTSFTTLTTASTCGSNNGALSITGVTGGIAPYTYSIGGGTFKSDAAFASIQAGTYTVTVKDAKGCTISKSVTVTNIAGPTDLAVSTTPSTCGSANGSITAGAVTGGTANYTYSINNGVFQSSGSFENLLAGDYTISVKDANGCVFSKQVTLTDIAGPAFTASAISSTCGNSNGQIRIGTVTGGTAPFEYSKDGGTTFQTGTTFSALAAGDYTITIKDKNGCLATRSVTVTNIAGPTDVMLAPASSTCGNANGSINVGPVMGGTSPYTYALGASTTFQTGTTFGGLLAGEYTIKVKDFNGCITSKKVVITDVAGPTGMTVSNKPATCGNSNGEILVSAVSGGTAPYKYSKDGSTFQDAASFAGLSIGSHTITVRDQNGCEFAASYTITNVAGPTAVAVSSLPASCNNNDGTITAGTVSGGTAPYKYSINGNNFQTETVFSAVASGVYTLTVQDANGCTVTRQITVIKNIPTAFTTSAVASTCGSNNGELIVTGVTGGFAPYTYSIDGNPFQSNASFTQLLAGAHTITVKDTKGCTISKSLTVSNIAGPTDLSATATASTCGSPNGQIVVNGVTGGTSTYSYSIDGQNYQASATFSGLMANTYTVYTKDANGCMYSEAVKVTNIAGPAFTAAAKASTCGNSNGSISITSVTSGTAPFSYSIDGATYQTGNTFSALAAGDYTITVKDKNNCLATRSVTVTNIAGPTDVALTPAFSTCGSANGSINIGTVTGGTSPYTYALGESTTFQTGTTFGGLLAGEYTIKVKDANGCITSKKVVVIDVAGPTGFTATTKSATCGNSNGELTVTGVTGGTAPYSYSRNGSSFQISATFAGLAAGDHVITVKDKNGCTFVKTFTITNVAGPTAISASSLPTSCANNDGTITAGTVSGGTAPYKYSINGEIFQTETTFLNIASGSYTLTVQDANGCEVTTSVTVTKNILTGFITSTTASTCGNSNGKLNVTGVTGGFAPYTYSIDGSAFQSATAFENVLAGEYTVTVKDSKNCTITKKVQVTNIAGPTDVAVTTKPSTCGNPNGSITAGAVTGGTSSYTYSINGGSFQSAGAFTKLLAGDYTISVKDANGCVYSEQVTLTDIAGPVFTASATASTCGNSNGQIRIGTVTGGTAPFEYSKDGGTTFQTSSTFSTLAAGDYTITIKDKNGCLATRAVTVTNIAGPTDVALAPASSTCGSANGSINVGTVTGGTAPYTYALGASTTFQAGTTFGGLLAGEYTIKVKDFNGCITSKKVVVTDVAGPSGLVATTKSTTCGNSNGELTVTGVTGGTSPYSYSKDGVNFQPEAFFTGLAAIDYTITVKDKNGCIFAAAYTITNIAGPTAVTASSLPASCADNDGSITAGTVTGGTASYTYSIDGSNFQSEKVFAGLASGTYTLTVKDANECTVTTSVRVTKNIPTAFTASATASKCGQSNGQLAVTGVTGGFAPYTYSINGGAFQPETTFGNLLAGAYTITVKDARGCTISKSVTLSNIAGPTDLTATAQTSTCGNANGQIVVNGVTGGTPSYTYAINNGAYQNAGTFTALAAGTYTVSVKDANGCVYSEEIEVTNVAGPAFTTEVEPSTCGNSNGSIAINSVTSGTAPFTYSLDGMTFQEATTFEGLAAATYTVWVKDDNDCVASTTVILKNLAGPSDLALTTTSSTCGATNGVLTVAGVTDGTAPYTYAINGGDFQDGTTFEDLLAGEYTVTVKDAKGCSFSKKIMLENVAGPSDLTASLTATTCGNSNGELTLTNVSGGTAPYTYSKDGVNFQEAATFTALAAGRYAITVKDENGCTFVKTFTITNIAGPTAATATSLPATCADNDGILTAGTVTGGTAPYKYSIDGSNFVDNKVFGGLASGTYTLTVKDANGCLITRSVTVGKNVSTSFTSTSTASTCGDSNGTFTITGVTGGKAPYSYAINGGAYQESATFTALAAGTYSASVKDANGCVYNGSVQVSNVAGPAFTATAQASTCGSSNGSISISNVSGGTAPYSYSKDGRNFQTTTTFNDLLSGEYTIITKDENGCISSAIVVVEDVAGPGAVELTAAKTTCGDSNGSINVGPVTGGTAPYTFALNGSSTFQVGSTFTSLSAGEHTITVRDAKGCVLTQKVVLENVAGPTDMAVNTTSTTCGANNGKLTITGVTGGTAPYQISLNGAPFQEATTFENLVTGAYTIRVKDANGCTTQKSITITNIAGPTAVAATSLPATCADNDGSITAGEVTGGTAPYTYSINGTNFKADALFEGLASGVYTLTAKDVNGCTTTTSVTVGQNFPTNFASTTTASTCGNSNGTLTVTGVTGGFAPYTYSINGTDFQESASFDALAAGTFTITVKDARDCIFAKEVLVTNITGPSDVAATAKSSTCGNSNGEISIASVTGGTAAYTYSIDGEQYQASANFTALAAGTYQVSVKDANGCVYSEEIEVTNLAAPAFTATAEASTCSASNGTITIGDIVGGTAPFKFSRDGKIFQAETAFNGLASGTYTITAKDANGCLSTVEVEVTDISGPTDFALATTSSTCGAANGTITASEVAGGTAPYAYSIDGGSFQDSPAFENVLAGQRTLTVKDKNSCIMAKSITVEDVAGPSNLAASLTASTCGQSNGELTLTEVTGGTAPYSYSIDGVNFQESATFAALLAGQHTITVNDANGCIFVNTFTISDIAGPNAFAANSLPATCADNDGSISIGRVTGGTTPYTYSINGGTYQESAVFAALASGTYSITIKDANGCTFSEDVLVNKNVTTSFTHTTVSSTCGNSNGQFTVTRVTGGTAPYAYSIDGGTTYQNNATFSALAAGVYTVTVKDTKGCMFTDQVQLNDASGPAFKATATASTCGNSNGQVQVSEVSGGAAPFSYSIDGGAFQTAGTFTNLAAGTHYITTKDANGCSSIKAIEVGNIAGPSNLALQTVSSTCGNSTGQISISGVTEGTAPYTYSINGVDFQASNVFKALAAGEYTVTVKDANGCTFATKAAVGNINGPTNFMASTIASRCGTPNGELTVGEINGGIAPYTYSNDGQNFQSDATFTGLAAGEHTITIKDANGCTFVRTFTIKNIAGPTAIAAKSAAATCADNNGSITAGEVTGGTAPYTYSINGVDFQQGMVFTGIASGAYTLTVQDANGCIATTAVVVEMITPTAFASATKSATCGSSNGEIAITGVTGGTAPYTYSVNGSSFQESAAFADLAAGVYTITVKDANGCTFTAEVQVANTDGPSELAATTTAATCGNSNGELKVTGVTEGAAPYAYSIDGTNFQESGTFAALLAGTYTLSVRDANGCVYMEEVEVTNLNAPTFTATAEASTCGASNGLITIGEVVGGTSPFEFSRDGESFQTETAFSGLAAGTYTITAKDANGCLSTVEVEVTNIAGPTDFALATTSSTCGAANGTITASDVAGGTAPYTYAIDGGSFQDSPAFGNVLAGEHTVAVKDANGCIMTKKITLEDIAGPTDLAASLTATTCGQSNGALTLTEVTGGTAPYTYAIDGVNFQESATFAALLAGQHTITVMDKNGCTFVKSFTISNITGPVAATATTTPATCADNDGTITAGTVTGGTAPYTYSINGVEFIAETVFAGVASGSHTLTVKDANGCTITTSVEVGKSIPTSFTSTTRATTCGASNGQLTITGVTGGTAPYTYSMDGVTFAEAATFTELTAGAYTITVKDAKGCTFASEVQVDNISGPADFVATAQAATCSDSNGEISVGSVQDGVAPYSYSLDGVHYQEAATFAALAAGAYEVSVKDANGCVIAKQVQVENASGPVFTAVAQASTCGGSNGSITINDVTGGAAPYTFSTNGTNFQASATFNNMAAGTYNVTTKDANGCLSIITVEIENVAGPESFELTSAAATCGASNGSIAFGTVTGGTAPYTYAINNTGFQSTSTFESLAAGTYTATVKDAEGCTVSKQVVVGNGTGIADITTAVTASACNAHTGSITVDAVNGGTAPYQYSLDGMNYQATATFTALAPQEYTVHVKDANGCSTSVSVSIGTNAPTEAMLAATPAGCATPTGTIRVAGVTGGTQQLAYSIDGVNFQAATLFENLVAGTYTITIKDAAGCSITRTAEVISTGGANAFTVTATDAGCGAPSGSLITSNISGGKAPYTYAINGAAFQTSAIFAKLTSGTYRVSVKDATGCIKTQEATVNGAQPLANLQVQVTPAGCGPNSGQAVASGVTGGTAPYTYSMDGVNFSATTTFAGVAPGKYTLTVKDASNCSITAPVVIETISSKIARVKDESCFGAADGEIVITATGATGETAYSIDNGASYQKTAVFANLPQGVYQVITRFTPSCSITIGSVEVKGPSEIVAMIEAQTKTIGQENFGSATITSVTGGTAPYTYQVDNGSFSTATVLNNLGGGEHTLLVKDAKGCTAAFKFTIDAITDIEIPNGFTPNGDGLNDKWAIKNLALLYPRCRVTVYNRWGSPVFTSRGYTKEWDGTHNGKALPDGTYYTIIELGDGQAPMKRSVTIMR